MKTIDEINRAHAVALGGLGRLVFGEGDGGSPLMLVGEAPGAQEEALGRPFVGTAGKNLDQLLLGVGLRREALYITNAVKFRPTKPGGSGRLSNRTPTRAETALFQPWLMEEVRAIRPRVIATLGNTALHAVSGGIAVIGDVHGRPLSLSDGGAVIFPLYHPASIIYRRTLLPVYEADIAALKKYIENW